MPTPEQYRQTADEMWRAMADLGYVDHLGGAQYEHVFADQERVYELADAAYGIVGRLMIGAERSNESCRS